MRDSSFSLSTLFNVCIFHGLKFSSQIIRVEDQKTFIEYKHRLLFLSKLIRMMERLFLPKLKWWKTRKHSNHRYIFVELQCSHTPTTISISTVVTTTTIFPSIASFIQASNSYQDQFPYQNDGFKIRKTFKNVKNEIIYLKVRVVKQTRKHL